VDLVLIRHAEPVRVVEAGGPADPPLHERGRAQAQALAAWLEGEHLDAVWSSPMRRARETAAAVGSRLGMDVVVDEDLAEFDREATSYIPLEELRARRDERWVAMVEGNLAEFDVDPDAFRAGVVDALERIVSASPGATVAVVCHGGVINAYAAHVLGIDRVLFFEPRYASINRFAAARQGTRSVVSLNETAHLRGLL